MSDDDYNDDVREYSDEFEDGEDRYEDNERVYDDDDSRYEGEDEDQDFERPQVKKRPRKQRIQKETSTVVEKNLDLFDTLKDREATFESAFEECLKSATDNFAGVNRIFGSRKLDKTLHYCGALQVSKHLLSVSWSLLVTLTNVLYIDNPETFPAEGQTKWLAFQLTYVVFLNFIKFLKSLSDIIFFFYRWLPTSAPS